MIKITRESQKSFFHGSDTVCDNKKIQYMITKDTFCKGKKKKIKTNTKSECHSSRDDFFPSSLNHTNWRKKKKTLVSG